MKNYRQKIMRQIILSIVAFFTLYGFSHAQGWEKTFSGPSVDVAYNVITTTDGNMVVRVQSFGGLGFPQVFWVQLLSN